MKMKKLFVLFIIFHCNSLLPAAVRQPWARIVPLAYDNGQWKVLLGQNQIDNSWSDFGKPIDDKLPAAVAQEALSEQTNQEYNIDMNDLPMHVHRKGADTFFFMEGPFIRGAELYKKGRNKVKKDFVWLPVTTVNALLIGRNIPHQKESARHPISSDFHQAFKDAYWEIPWDAPTEPATGAAAAPGAPVTPPPGTSDKDWQWLIPKAAAFYVAGKDYYIFSNTYPYPKGKELTLEGRKWPSSEHYFQWKKFSEKSPQIQQEAINLLRAKTPGSIQAEFRDPQSKLSQLLKPPSKKWHSKIKFNAMKNVMNKKFAPGSKEAQQLLGTGNMIIIENAPSDDTWGIAYKGTKPGIYGVNPGEGTNHLGRMLMLRRKELQDNATYQYDRNKTLTLAHLTAHGYDPTAALDAMYTPGKPPAPPPPGQPDVTQLAQQLTQLQGQLQQLMGMLTS